MKRSIVAAALSVALSASWVMPANAATTCSLSEGVLSVSVDLDMETEGYLLVYYDPGTGALIVSEYLFELRDQQPVACTGGPTTSNTESIEVSGTSTIDALVTLLIPGGTAEPTQSEIEMTTSGIDVVAMTGDNLVAGAAGIHLNGADDDADLSYVGAQALYMFGSEEGSFLSADGDATSGGPVQVPVVLLGSPQGDILIGGDNYDILVGGEGRDQISGGLGSDHHGELAESSLFEGGNDTFLDSPGNDSFYGGFGTDTVSFAPSAERVIVTTGDNTANDGPVSEPGLIDGGVENLIGGPFGDVLKANTPGTVANRLIGGGGNDQLLGYGGADNLIGSGGDDTLTGAGGNDRLTGGGGRDLLRGGDGGDNLLGGDASDRLYGDGGTDALDGGAASDLCDGGAGKDSAVRCETRRAISSASPWSWTAGGGSAQVAEDLPEPVIYENFLRAVLASDLAN